MFLTIKKKWLIIFISIFLIVLCSTIFFVTLKVKSVSSFHVPNAKWTVIIDAGHGGIDGGSVGKTYGAIESELNLSYSKTLASQLNSMGINTVLTRTNADGLYDSDAKSLKKSDMKKRKEIIESVNPTLVVSIHMNSFSSGNAKGAQTFYKKGNAQGEKLAKCVQQQLRTNLENTTKQCAVGDYYILNCTDYPSVLVECGFLSNAEEEKLLQQEAYKTKVCYSILSGIMAFLNKN